MLSSGELQLASVPQQAQQAQAQAQQGQQAAVTRPSPGQLSRAGSLKQALSPTSDDLVLAMMSGLPSGSVSHCFACDESSSCYVTFTLPSP
jgi:hypothetical protein